jgi:hypothetical protein
MLEEFDQAIEEAAENESVGVVIGAGAGQHFSAGHDIGGPQEKRDQRSRPYAPGMLGEYKHGRDLYLDNTFVPFYHTLAGQFDPVSGLPAGLTFTRDVYLFDLLQEFPSWWVVREFFELNALQCNELDLPYNDHLGEVKVPVLYVGAHDGFGQDGDYSTTLLGRREVTALIVSLLPEQPLDFGHSDLLWADNAPTIAWGPIYNWLRNY